ncbi:hypothetical protein N1851_015722 [Merluccius polli]|uniref:CxC3 like cysteine cluster domain-containing protein n=1 Tax=Merluccius polli TaxID=89951 RepID=A0AA47MSK1_MERPO|nr:hypothetical protein N1851_015722 [Merluccius polli]
MSSKTSSEADRLKVLLQESSSLLRKIKPPKKRKKVKPKFTWRQRDAMGRIVSQRSRPSTSQDTELDNLIQLLEEPVIEQDLTNVEQQDWATQQHISSQKWEEARPQLLENYLKLERCVPRFCQHCHNSEAVIRCRDCLPLQYFCGACDLECHRRYALHNRCSMNGFFSPIPPSTVIGEELTHQHHMKPLPLELPQTICGCPVVPSVVCSKPVVLITMKELYCGGCAKTWTPDLSSVQNSGYWPANQQLSLLYDEEVFQMFETLKLVAPGSSRLALMRVLNMKTAAYGRTGTVCGDTFQRSYNEWAICHYTVSKLCVEEPFTCPACHPDMLAVAVDGNRKLYRFKNLESISEDSGYFKGVFICKDEDVASFVDDIQSKTHHAGFQAAKEKARKSCETLDEEGLEVAVCRHGVLLKALNMFRGEMMAYPLKLQVDLASHHPSFFCMDVTCKYTPYLKKVCNACPE